jgi:hypothetical protein
MKRALLLHQMQADRNVEAIRGNYFACTRLVSDRGRAAQHHRGVPTILIPPAVLIPAQSINIAAVMS